MTLDRQMLTIAAAGVCTLLSPSAGSACSFAQGSMTASQIKQQAADHFKRATVLIDAEVIEPMSSVSDSKPGLTPTAYLRVLKTWKGGVQPDLVPVVYISSCDIVLERKGERLRILLIGEGVFRADQGMNGGGVIDLPTYNAEIDRLAGQRRSTAMDQFPGALPSPEGN
ncbi:hypothetical protein [Sphingomonas sp. 37zxx]|uniref:hypothetical protein n=1 Tax=Sphingomonas sp. 37zxx TaxID=1550073 RepID=UPI00103C2E5B|nr:hypothetical protein [Sphingomonas sp. 37zxx]